MTNGFYKAFLFILLANSIVWVRSSYTKWVEGKFVAGLGKTLEKFASNNPYPFFKDFLNKTAIPNAEMFGTLTLWGETFAAFGSLSALLYLLWKKEPKKWAVGLLIVSLAVGALLNLVFWLASGWTSPSTDSLNMLMFLTQVIGIIFAFKLFRS